jgi:hypothetical protein
MMPGSNDPGYRDIDRAIEDLLDRPLLTDPALIQHDQMVRQGQRLDAVMRDKDDGDTELGQQASEFRPKLLTDWLVKGRQRFIEQE